MKYIVFVLILTTVLLSACQKKAGTEPEATEPVWETPQQVIQKIARGINIGNTLEPPDEGEWNNGPMQEYYFDDIKAAGFSCVRIPVRWDRHTADSPPYAVQEEWQQRVEQIVDWGLARGLYLIINAHHEWWLVNDYADPAKQARFDSIWVQVAERFKDKSPRLMFEIINEPHGVTQQDIDELNTRILQIIRKNNPQRIVIYGGHEWSAAANLFSAAIPDDDYLMGYYHSYDPWNFAGEAQGTWGTSSDIQAVKSAFETVAAWSRQNNIPVMISEFGAVRQCDYNSRMLFYYTYVEHALRNGIAFQAWDDGGNFGIYDRQQRRWPEVKDILLHTGPGGPVLLYAGRQSFGHVYLSWQNRSADYSRITIQRSTDGYDFENAAVLNSDAQSFTDSDAANVAYIYRVIAHSGETEMYSNPMWVDAVQ